MPSLKFDLKDVLPLLGGLGVGGKSDKPDVPTENAPPSSATVPATPPPPPPPVPAAAGFGEWSADPQNSKKVADGITAPGTPLLTPPAVPPMIAAPPPGPSGSGPIQMAPSRVLTDPSVLTPPPGRQFASLNPPQVGTQNAPPSTATVPTQDSLYPMPTPAAPLPTSAPTQAQAAQTQMNLDMAANPDQYQHRQLQGQGFKGFLKFGIPAALVSAGSGLNHGDPSAGFKLLDQQTDRDNNVPAANLATYEARNVQPLKDAAVIADTQSQTAQRLAQANKADAQADNVGNDEKLRSKQIADAAKLGLKPTYDENGQMNGQVVDPDSPITKSRGLKDQLTQAQVDSTNSQEELRKAQADLAKAKNDPKSPVFRQAQQRVNIAQQNASLTAQRLSLSTQQFLLHSQGVDANGNAYAGAELLDDGTPVGTAFQKNVAPTGAQRTKGNLADSAAEQIGDLKSLVRKRQDIFGPAAGRTTDFTTWVGSQDPDAQRFRAARTIAGDHLAAVFGGRSETALSALDNAIGSFKDNPEAVEAGLDQLGKANVRFQEAGKVHVSNGKGITAPPAKSSAPAGATQEVYAADGKTLIGHVVDGKYVKLGKK